MREYIGSGVEAVVNPDGSVTIQDSDYDEDMAVICLDRASVEALLKLIEKGKLK